MIEKQRLWQRLMALSRIGSQEGGGVTRLSFTDEEREAKELVRSFMQEAGLNVYEDAVGNLVGRKEGTRSGAPVVLIGSHIDSVFNGGNFDGPLGVLAGVEVAQALHEGGIETEHPIEVIAFTDEEGARFRFGMIGSRAVAGTLTQADLRATDKDGVSIADAMRQRGFHPHHMEEAARAQGSVLAYVELHIEQGKVLEDAGLSVGVVQGIAGPLWLRFTLSGASGHAGTTPMPMRRDALAAAAAILQVMEHEASKELRTVATVGQLNVLPGGVNIIPGRVEFTLDLRDVDEPTRDKVEHEIRRRAERICADRGVTLEIAELQRVAPVHCSDKIQEAAMGACEEVGLQTMPLVSGAGHDGMQLANLCKVGMIFIRSKDGVSHQPDEWSSPEDCADGATVLYQTVLRLARRVG